MIIENLEQLSQEIKNELSEFPYCHVLYYNKEDNNSQIKYDKICITFKDSNNEILNTNWSIIIHNSCHNQNNKNYLKCHPNDIDVVFYHNNQPLSYKTFKNGDEKYAIKFIKKFAKNNADLIKIVKVMKLF